MKTMKKGLMAALLTASAVIPSAAQELPVQCRHLHCGGKPRADARRVVPVQQRG